MNPFQKRKEAREAKESEFNNRLLQVEQQFDAAIKRTDQLNDPAVKIIALRNVSSEINAQLMTEAKAVIQEAKAKGRKADRAGTGATVAATVTTGLLLTGPLGWVCLPVAIGGMVGSDIVAYKRQKAVGERLADASSSHIQRLKSQAAHAEALVDDVIKNNVEAISNSPLKEKVLAMPGLSAKFSKAAAEHIATVKEPEAAEKPAADSAPPADKAPPVDKGPKKLRLVFKPGK